MWWYLDHKLTRVYFVDLWTCTYRVVFNGWVIGFVIMVLQLDESFEKFTVNMQTNMCVVCMGVCGNLKLSWWLNAIKPPWAHGLSSAFGGWTIILRTMSDLVIMELTRTEVVFKRLVYSSFNYLMWLVAQEVHLNMHTYEDADVSLVHLMVI